MKIRDDIVLGQSSHVGMARTENQDFFGYWESDDERQFDLKGRLAVVCDGMGGHAGGEIASRLAVKTILEVYEKDTSGNIQEALRRAIEAANAAIWKEGDKEPKLKGMGATCTALVHRRDMVYFGQVGDSRGYLIRGGQIAQMTKDHSLVQQLVDEGLIDKSEMESHPDKNVILRSLGVKPSVDVDVSYVPAAAGDIFLICSDGLSGPVSENEMLGIVQASNGEMSKASGALIDLANKYGGYDNITVQLVKVKRTDTATTDKTQEGTVTSSFSQDQVAESIAKARAEAAAKGKAVPPPKSTEAKKAEAKKTEATPAPALPAPTPAAAAAKGGGGAGGLIMLIAGLIVGVAIGGVGVFGAAKMGLIPMSNANPVSEWKAKSGEAQKDAEAARDQAAKAKKDEAAFARGERELDAAKKAAATADYETAFARSKAAIALFEVAAGVK